MAKPTQQGLNFKYERYPNGALERHSAKDETSTHFIYDQEGHSAGREGDAATKYRQYDEDGAPIDIPDLNNLSKTIDNSGVGLSESGSDQYIDINGNISSGVPKESANITERQAGTKFPTKFPTKLVSKKGGTVVNETTIGYKDLQLESESHTGVA